MFEFTTYPYAELNHIAVALGVPLQEDKEPFDTFIARLRAKACSRVDAAIRDLLWQIDQPQFS